MWCSPANSFKFQPCDHTSRAVDLTTPPALGQLEAIKTPSHIVYGQDCRVSNRFALARPSPSGSFQLDTFATGVPPRITGFHPYPGNCLQPLPDLSHDSISSNSTVKLWDFSETYQTGYGRFRPNKSGYHLSCRCYRGGWHRSCPALIPEAFYTSEKPPR